jgi:hypothetical protein
MTRTRGGGEPEGDGVSRAALHSSVPDRRFVVACALVDACPRSAGLGERPASIAFSHSVAPLIHGHGRGA